MEAVSRGEVGEMTDKPMPMTEERLKQLQSEIGSQPYSVVLELIAEVRRLQEETDRPWKAWSNSDERCPKCKGRTRVNYVLSAHDETRYWICDSCRQVWTLWQEQEVRRLNQLYISVCEQRDLLNDGCVKRFEENEKSEQENSSLRAENEKLVIDRDRERAAAVRYELDIEKLKEECRIFRIENAGFEEASEMVERLKADNQALTDLIYGREHEGAKYAASAIMQLTARLSTLEAALREIAEHKHLTGTMDDHATGHRCAAEISRKALESK